jgi:anti-anti-sigma regulatory factor
MSVSTFPGRFECEDFGELIVIRPTKEVMHDCSGMSELGEYLKGLVSSGKTKIVVNFADVDRLVSCVIGSLIVASRQAIGADGGIALANLSQELTEILDVLQVGQFFTLHDSEKAAIDSFREMPPMNETTWLECDDVRLAFSFLRGRASDRKHRLFACACARRTWALLRHPWSRKVIEIAEQCAEQQARLTQLQNWAQRAGKAIPASGPAEMHAASAAHCAAADHDFNMFVGSAYHAGSALGQTERAVQRRLRHCIFGNPFRPIAIESAWLTPTVQRVAQAAYDERILPSGELDPVRLAVLADALEEAGCTDPNMLGHLRDPGPHVRGCFVVDALLGKT